MSSLKRKDAPGGTPPSKSAKSNKASRPSKRDTPTKDRKEKKSEEDAPAPRAPTVSRLLKDEEPLFPRGGGSVLTPLEQKQITMEAKADAAKEQAEFDVNEKSKAKKEKRRKAKETKDTTKPTRDEDAVKIEGLNFKRLVKGSLVLGQISHIDPVQLTVALPNNLTGHVSIASISDTINSKLEGAMETSDNESEDEDEEDDVDLKSMFKVGQYVRAYVLSTSDDAAVGKAKRRIELSLRPVDTNTGVSSDDVVANITLMASISSVQDHGYEMDLGIKGDLKGFLSKKEVAPDMDEASLRPGAVCLCVVKSVTGIVVQLSTDPQKLSNTSNVASNAPTINSFQPGSLADVLLTEVTKRGLQGKLLGHLPVTADLIHSGVGPDGVDLDAKYKVGARIKARIICNFPAAREPKLGISLLPHVIKLESKASGKGSRAKAPLDALPIASFVETCTVRQVEPEIGLYVDTGVANVSGFVHISRVKDGKVDALYESSGPFKVGTTHRGRVVGYSPLDGMFLLSFEKSVLDQAFIRLEDVPIGEVVSGKIDKMIVGGNGVSGLIVKLAENITGFVHESHLADVKLQHPEKKFREGMTVKARVLSVRLRKHQLRLTLKKTLVNSDSAIIKNYEDVEVGMQTPGTITSVSDDGARLEFFGDVRGFLPLSQMSEAYIKDPKEHFRTGQVVSVHVLSVVPEDRKLVVSCKDPSAFGLDKQEALKSLKVGDLVSAKVSQKTEDEVFVDLEESGLKAILRVGHLSDKSASKTQAALKRIHVGQTLTDLMVLDKNERRRAVILTQKPSFIEASKNGKLLSNADDVTIGAVVPAYVREIGPHAVYVQFGGNLTAILPKPKLAKDVQEKEAFGMRKHQSIEVKIVSSKPEQNRIIVAPASAGEPEKAPAAAALNSIDEKIRDVNDVELGTIMNAKVTSVKATQLNVKVADNIQGRIDVSQFFDSFEDITDRKTPLKKVRNDEIIRVRAIGIHDSKNYRFLPFSHRSTHSLIELTAKKSDLEADEVELLSYEKVKVGASYPAFVNNHGKNCLWVNLSPTVRGRIGIMEVSDDLSHAGNLEKYFPIGSALKVRVLSVDAEKGHLDLSSRSTTAVSEVTWDSLKKNTVLPGRVTKVNDRQLMVKLSDTVSGPVHLVDLCDDYEEANTLKLNKGAIIRVAVVEVDKSNKRLRLSTRPSRILSSTSPVADREITSAHQLSSGDIVRGFVKNVADKGVFVQLGGNVSALVKIANLSDRYIKDWRGSFQIDQLVKGRVINVDAAANQVELNLKASVVENDYTPPISWKDVKEGQIVTGKVRKVEEFGAFIVVDNSTNVSGLCHRSEMAEKPVEDARKLYNEGDVVKAKVIAIDDEKRRITFSLKPSHFDEDSDMDDVDGGAELDSDDDSDVEMGDGVQFTISGTDNVDDSDDDEEEEESDAEDSDVEMEETSAKKKGLSAGKYDWTGDAFDESDNESGKAKKSSTADKKEKKKGEIQVDRTADLDAHGPQTATDYERLLLGQPDSSQLWIEYMALQMKVSELSKAREIAERAIKTINIREQEEKLNVWIAYLNLEVAYGTKASTEEVFKRACLYNDEKEVHERLASIYIQSGKLKQADDVFQSLVNKFKSKSPDVWVNYAHFLHVTMNEPDRARALLPRATQALDQKHTAQLMARFAALEFKSPNGDAERGRTTFATILATWPKRFDFHSQLVDLELSAPEPDAAAIRDAFEMGTKAKGLKPKKAMKWFKRWADWEEKLDPKGRDKVMAKAQEWVAAKKAAAAASAAAEEEEDDE
ncbi:rRNA biogenesis protein [Colletotrichum karsti]|uniref:rRNA biogenesis protein RRP5 n=1 Tax=Colletotrichum karsti TaxID=1095194 RepID=A0A9P6IF32_9PEZI|nr:rRNA biogenesis protein [Colletotrichum karsti]KAF9877510.1 rRNA biogenesis protein [Colletotrichum karsti]